MTSGPARGADKVSVLVTVSGRDAPGITAELTGILADHKAVISDITQAVIHGLLSLSILFEARAESESQQAVKDLLFKASGLGLRLEHSSVATQKGPDGKSAPAPVPYRYAITLIADRISASGLSAVARALARQKTNIDSIRRLSDETFGCVEMIVSSQEEIDHTTARKELLTIAANEQLDIALQDEGLYRRAKRLVVMDMDSTLIQNEVIDELAKFKGVHAEVAAITLAAMSGKIDYATSLHSRCEKLKGLKAEDLERVYRSIEITSGATDLIRVLKKLGYKIALISGGFTFVAERLKQKLGIDYAYANTLELIDNEVTGRVIPPIVDAQRKADLLELISQQEKIDLDQVIAVGDGANDVPMLERAGLGIAFNAKPSVREKADLSINQKNLRSILYLLGLTGRDLAEALGGRGQNK